MGVGQGGVEGGKVALVQQSMSNTAQHSTAQHSTAVNEFGIDRGFTRSARHSAQHAQRSRPACR